MGRLSSAMSQSAAPLTTALAFIACIATPIAVAAEGTRDLKIIGVHKINGTLLAVKKPKDITERKPSKDISGIACAPAENDGRRLCLAIEDEGASAQVIFLNGEELSTDHRVIPLLDGVTPGDVFGLAPNKHHCPNAEEDAFGELDGEGAAYHEGYFYIVGSHGCSRKHGKFGKSSFITVRLKLKSSGEMTEIQRTYRLSDALRNSPASEYFTRELENQQNISNRAVRGLNVEGVAALDGKLYAGLRAPSLDGFTYLIGAPLNDLFTAGHAPLTTTPTTIKLPLGAGVGVRDLAALPNRNKLLILAGPTGEDPTIRYSTHIYDFANQGKKLKFLGFIPKSPNNSKKETEEKPEAILPISDDGKNIIILLDGRINNESVVYSAP